MLDKLTKLLKELLCSHDAHYNLYTGKVRKVVYPPKHKWLRGERDRPCGKSFTIKIILCSKCGNHKLLPGELK